MKKEISSEEKLLNLIRKKNPAPKEKKTREHKEPGAGQPMNRVPDLSGTSVKVMAAVCLVLGLYIVGNRFFIKEPVKVGLLSGQQETNPGEQVEIMPEPRPFHEYAQILGQRDIFASPFHRVADLQPSAAQDASSSLPAFDFSQNYRVVGIMVDNDPKAIIEDIRNQRTLFLSYGDELEGGKLEEIRDGKVVFLFNGQRVELIP